jgi:predicted metal-binding protein
LSLKKTPQIVIDSRSHKNYKWITPQNALNENLIPVVEFKITVNKEALQDHRSFWKELFAHHYGKVLSCPPKWDSVLMERYLRENIVNRFRKFILQPVLKLQEEVLKDEDISKLS